MDAGTVPNLITQYDFFNEAPSSLEGLGKHQTTFETLLEACVFLANAFLVAISFPTVIDPKHAFLHNQIRGLVNNS